MKPTTPLTPSCFCPWVLATTVALVCLSSCDRNSQRGDSPAPSASVESGVAASSGAASQSSENELSLNASAPPNDILDIVTLGPSRVMTEEEASSALRIRDFAQSAASAGVRRIITHGCYRECLDVLFGTSLAPTLVEIWLEECGGREMLVSLLEHVAEERLSSLRHLRIVGCTSENDDGQLQRSSTFAPIGLNELRMIEESALGEELLALGMPAQRLCRDSLEFLSETGTFPNLQALDLRLNHCLTEDDLMWWADNDERDRLKYLNLSFNRLSDDFSENFGQRHALPSLVQTELGSLLTD